MAEREEETHILLGSSQKWINSTEQNSENTLWTSTRGKVVRCGPQHHQPRGSAGQMHTELPAQQRSFLIFTRRHYFHPRQWQGPWHLKMSFSWKLKIKKGNGWTCKKEEIAYSWTWVKTVGFGHSPESEHPTSPGKLWPPGLTVPSPTTVSTSPTPPQTPSPNTHIQMFCVS